jgi:hypothetical protein
MLLVRLHTPVRYTPKVKGILLTFIHPYFELRFPRFSSGLD